MIYGVVESAVVVGSWESSAPTSAKGIFRNPDVRAAAADGEALARHKPTTSGFWARNRILPPT